MFKLIKQAFIVLLSFSNSFAANCPSLNNGPYMVRPALIDLTPGELKYYPYMDSLDKYSGNYNFDNDFSTKKYMFQAKQKKINVKASNKIRINEAKVFIKHNHVIVDINSIVQHLIQIKSEIPKLVNVSVEIIILAKRLYLES